MSCTATTTDPFAGFRTAMASNTTAVTAPTVATAPKETADPLIAFGTICSALPEGKDYSCLLPPNFEDREELGSCASTTAAGPLSGSLTKDPTSPVVDSLEGIPTTQAGADIPAVTKTAPATPVTPTIATPSPIANSTSPIQKHSPPLAPAKPSYMPTTTQSLPATPKNVPTFTALQPRAPLSAGMQTAPPMTAPVTAPAQPVRQALPTAASAQQQQQQQQYQILQTYQMQAPAQAAAPQTSVPAGYPTAYYYQTAQTAPAAAQAPVYYATSNGYYYQTSAQPAAAQAPVPMQASTPVYYAIQNPATGQLQYVAAQQPTAQPTAPTMMQQYAVMSANQASQQAGMPQQTLMYSAAPATYSMPSGQSVYYVQQGGVQAGGLAQAAAPSVQYYYTYAPQAVRR